MLTENLAINKDTLIQKRFLIINVFGKQLSRSFQIKIELKTKLHLLRKKTKIVSDNNHLAETFNNFFANIVPSLGLQCKDGLLASVEHIQNSLKKIIENSIFRLVAWRSKVLNP